MVLKLVTLGSCPDVFCRLYSGQSFLAVTFALQFVAAYQDARVLLLCNERSSCDEELSTLVQSLNSSDGELNRVMFRCVLFATVGRGRAKRLFPRYLPTDGDLRKFLAGIHLLPEEEVPNLLIINGLTSFFG